MMNRPRKQHSQWDLSKIQLNVDTNTDPVKGNDTEIRHSQHFSTIRHQSHYFSRIEALAANGYNYLKYAKYSEVKKTENTGSPRFTVSHLSFNTDLRSSWDCALLRLPRYHSTLVDINFELHAGDVMAMMYTSEWEMNCLIRLLSGAKMSRGKAGGEITINGHRLDKHQLRQRIGFLPTSFDLPPDLTVQQFLTISAMFYPSKTKNYHMDGMIHQYANTFALGPFKDCRISRLAQPEKVRLKIAVELLKDPCIFVCSTVLNSLDIYDLAFIINGLRDWAIKSKRIVILAIAPPTIDILNMFSKAIILSLGRVIYFGCPSKMCSYFSAINYNCPTYKNPCDYYVDLATYDYLTNEAEAESSMRIGHLISEWQRKAPPPVIRPLDLLPEEVGTANFLQVILALFRRMSYELLNRPYIFIILPLVSNIVSLLISLSFVSLSNDKRAGASERLGLVEALVFYSTIPINTTMILYLYSRRKSASWEFKAHIYGSLPYGVAKTLFDLSFLLISVLLFTLPIYFVTGFDSAPFSLSGLSSFSIVTFLFFFYLYMISLLVAHLFKSALLGTIVSICLNLVSFVVSGLPIHPLDQSLPFDGIRLISPHFWIEYAILQQNFMGTPLPMLSNNQTHELVIGCERTKVLAKKIKELPIYTVSACSKMRGNSLLYFHAFPPALMQKPLRELGSIHFFTLGFGIYSTSLLVIFVCFLIAFRYNRFQIYNKNK